MQEIYTLIHNLGQCCPIEHCTLMEIFHVCGFWYDRQWRHVAIEQLKCS